MFWSFSRPLRHVIYYSLSTGLLTRMAANLIGRESLSRKQKGSNSGNKKGRFEEKDVNLWGRKYEVGGKATT